MDKSTREITDLPISLKNKVSYKATNVKFCSVIVGVLTKNQKKQLHAIQQCRSER